MAEDLGEKTEDPTPRRLQKMREDGKVAKSTDLASALVLVAVIILLWIFTGPTLDRLGEMVGYTLETAGASGDVGTAPLLRSVSEITLLVLAPLLVAAWLAAYVSHVLQVGFLISPKPIEPNLNKLNPIQGIKRIIGIQTLVKGGLDIGKTVIALGVAGIVSWRMHDTLGVLPEAALGPAFAMIGDLVVELAIVIVIALLVLAILDYFFQRWKHVKDHRMTKDEVRRDFKDADGDPIFKQRRRQMAQQISMQRMAAAVPTADVIVTNPEHISVAIKYEEGSMHAPQVVALGVDQVALRIRRIAAEHGIPIVERKPLARLLHRTVKTGDFIPPDSYAAVAEVLAYVYRMNGQAA